MEEFNYSTAVGYSNRRFKAEFFHSSFYNKIGIFKGSHIGNLADLQKAFNSDTPAIRSGFTYAIGRPYQQVWHQLSKLNTEWVLNSESKFQASLAYQKNHREEYDILRSSSSYKGPDFNYYINTLLTDITFIKANLHGINFSTGVNGTYQANSFSGRFFIPGFYNKAAAAYFIAGREINKWKLEAAIRYDYKQLTAYLWKGNSLAINRLKFNNATYVLQGTYRKTKYLSVTIAVSSAWRPPAPNELYSNGLHQGLATIELGDSSLKAERSFNQVLGLRYAKKGWLIEAEVYDKYIRGFINLIPALPAQLTIRGAFPVYRYVQQDADLAGLNVLARRGFERNLYIKVSSNLLMAWNVKQHAPLSQMPPLSARFWAGKENKKYMLQLWYQATAKQFRYTEGSDFAAPPKGFALFGFDGSINFKVREQPFRFSVSVNNLLNTRYREYLNRFRYFSDAQGFGLTARLIMPVNSKIKKLQ
jgi:iron complex outermembrane receptor protein